MIVVIGSDHAGYELKQFLLPLVKEAGYEVLDVGTHSCDSVDYPDFAQKVGEAILEGKSEKGILICGSGIGASIAANKLPGIRAGICHDTYSAHQGVEHDDMNVLVMGSRVIGVQLAADIMRSYLASHFTGEERHTRRLHKVHALEAKFLASE
ncbi:Sugar phosphate isomerase YwlF [Planctomycetales bacterium 10988]|nr:Sugar phosphate isomerase YwlF [Planctomycetales bacterium 10988]